MAEAEDLKSSQCGFDPHSGHRFTRKCRDLNLYSKPHVELNTSATGFFDL